MALSLHCNYSMTTLFLVLKVLLATTAAPVYVDACDDDLCSVIDTANHVRTVARVALPKCAAEGLWTYAGHCLGVDAPMFAPGLPVNVVTAIDAHGMATVHTYANGFVNDDGRPETDYDWRVPADELSDCARHVGALTTCESFSHPVINGSRATDDGADIRL